MVSNTAISNQTRDISFYMLDGENKIIESAMGGEASAFGLLYDHYQPRIYRFVLIRVGQREEAEDLTHQVFLNAWQNIENYRHLGFPFSSWLYRIARNQVIDHYRTRKPDVSFEKIDPETLINHPVFELAIDNTMALDRIGQAIRTLKPEYQDVVIMRFVEDLSLKEVASAMGKSEGAIKLMQHRAIGQLKKLLS